jgi:hypothetical protein
VDAFKMVKSMTRFLSTKVFLLRISLQQDIKLWILSEQNEDCNSEFILQSQEIQEGSASLAFITPSLATTLILLFQSTVQHFPPKFVLCTITFGNKISLIP